jgi:hypothetical protein
MEERIDVVRLLQLCINSIYKRLVRPGVSLDAVANTATHDAGTFNAMPTVLPTCSITDIYV